MQTVAAEIKSNYRSNQSRQRPFPVFMLARIILQRADFVRH